MFRPPATSHVKATIRGMGVAAALATAAGYLAAVLLGAVTVDRSVSAAVLATFRPAPRWAGSRTCAACPSAAEPPPSSDRRGRLRGLIVLDGAVILVAAAGCRGNRGLRQHRQLHGRRQRDLRPPRGDRRRRLRAAGMLAEQPWLTAGGAVLAMSFLGFLPWNLGRGSVFLGDVGSYMLGASVAALAVAGFLGGVYVGYVLSPILVYAADTGTHCCAGSRRANAGTHRTASTSISGSRTSASRTCSRPLPSLPARSRHHPRLRRRHRAVASSGPVRSRHRPGAGPVPGQPGPDPAAAAQVQSHTAAR